MPDVTIQPATDQDGAAVQHLLAASGLPLDGVLDHLGTALVARRDGELLGCAALELYADGALLRSVAVAPSARGTGLGQRLTAETLALADRLGAPAVYLLTTSAERFFPRFGFAVVPRAEVPPGVQQSVEFRSACPASATVMRRAAGTA